MKDYGKDPMGPIRCCAKTCWKNSEHKHRFPNPKKHKNYFDKWVSLIGNPELLDKNPDKVYTNARLCSLHFTPNDFTSNNKLKVDTLPSVNLPAHSHNIPKSEVRNSPLNDLENVKLETYSEEIWVATGAGITNYITVTSTTSELVLAVQTPKK